MEPTTPVFEEYVEVQKQIDALEEKKKVLRIALEAALPEEGVKNEFGSFTFRQSKSWTYSPKVHAQEEVIKGLNASLEMETKKIKEELGIDNEQIALDKLKQIEELDGTAVADIKKSLVVKLN